jgi:hypothetical protein
MMMQTHEEVMVRLANDVFNKRQRLIKVSQSNTTVIDNHTASILEAEYRTAELEYREAKAAFARAMKVDRRASS